MRNPYVTGAYVTGREHYGRQELIDYLFHGPSRAYWVIGNRRIGKTSLLRQLEALALSEDRLIPLFWDMQGCDTLTRLGQYLADAIWDCGERFTSVGLSVDALPEEDALATLATLRRAALRAGRELLLLCDETEVLINIARAEPETIQRLHRELTSGAGIRVVATSTRSIYQMHDVCRDWPTSPFLAGFDMSQALGGLSSQSAHDLITQAQADEQVRAAPEVSDAISDYTNNHPYLIQLLCSRLFQQPGWLRPVRDDDLAVDPLLRGFFNNDFNSLTTVDRRIVGAVHQANVVDETALLDLVAGNAAELHQRLHDLERLGYLRRVYGQVAIGNQFLDNWLSMEGPVLDRVSAAQTSETAMRTALTRRQDQEADFLGERLNAKRARLVELEMRRARDLLAVPPQVLAEIEQLQTEISHLRGLLDEIRRR